MQGGVSPSLHICLTGCPSAENPAARVGRSTRVAAPGHGIPGVRVESEVVHDSTRDRAVLTLVSGKQGVPTTELVSFALSAEVQASSEFLKQKLLKKLITYIVF